MVRGKVLVFCSLASLLVSCGETKTIRSSSSAAAGPSERAQEKASTSEEGFQVESGSRITPQRLRFFCDDGSSYTSFLTASLKATAQAYSSRALMYWPAAGEERELVVDVQKPRIFRSSSDGIDFVFEGSLFSDSGTADDLFDRKVFLGFFDFKTKTTTTALVQDALDPEGQAMNHAQALKRSLRSYGVSETGNLLVVPSESQFSDRSYELKQIGSKAVSWPIACSAESCFNPQVSPDSSYVAFEVYDASLSRFIISVFKKDLETKSYEEHFVAETEAMYPQFVSKSKIIWLELRGDGAYLVLRDFDSNETLELSLHSREPEMNSFWLHSIDLSKTTAAVLRWSDNARLDIELLGLSSSLEPKSYNLDLSDIVDSEEGFRVYGFELITQSMALVSVDTVLGPRLLKLNFEDQKVKYEVITRSNCAEFSLGVDS